MCRSFCCRAELLKVLVASKGCPPESHTRNPSRGNTKKGQPIVRFVFCVAVVQRLERLVGGDPEPDNLPRLTRCYIIIA